MTLEREMVLVADLVDVLDSDASLEAAERKPRLIRKASDAPCLVLEGRFLSAVFSGLCPADIVYNELPVGGSDDQEIPPNVHVVDAFGKLEFSRRRWTSCVPELLCSVVRKDSATRLDQFVCVQQRKTIHTNVT